MMVASVTNRSSIAQLAGSPQNPAEPWNRKSGSHTPRQSLRLVQDEVLNKHLETVIPQITSQLTTTLRPGLEAIVLTGSFARGEGSVQLIRRRLKLLGDMEFMVFCSPRTNMTRMQRALAEQAQRLESKLADQAVDCELEFSPVERQYLRRLRPHIFGYELLTHGRIVWGNTDILRTAPAFPASSIPRWDAWRMLNNRLLEQLQCVEELRNGDRAVLERMLYQVFKCYIDIGTTLLIFAARYQPTYASRSAELLRWSEVAKREEGLSFLPTISQRVAACTAFKLFPTANPWPLGVQLEDSTTEELRKNVEKLFVELVPLAHEVWRWEAAELVTAAHDPQIDDSWLRDETLRTQRLQEKLRGWAKLALMPAVRCQRGFARRMSARVGQGSPRYLIYAVASELYFRSPAILKGEEPQVVGLESMLPVFFAEHAHETRPWWRLRANALSGWRLFLRNHWA